MNEPERSSGGGWNFFKILGLAVGFLGMAGFGVCGLCGLLIGVTNMMGIALVCGLAGLLIAGAFYLLFRAMLRSGLREPPDAP